jgi:hypothetical protein
VFVSIAKQFGGRFDAHNQRPFFMATLNKVKAMHERISFITKIRGM